jgi:hypothetical protein
MRNSERLREWKRGLPALGCMLKGLVVLLLAPIVTLLVIWGDLAATYAVVGAVYPWGAGRFWDRAEPETFLVPANYRGTILVAYGRPNAPPTEREGPARVFRVPSHGVVETREPPPEHRRSTDVYLVHADGRREFLSRGGERGDPCSGASVPGGVRLCRAKVDQGSYGFWYELWYLSRAPITAEQRNLAAETEEPRLLARLGVTAHPPPPCHPRYGTKLGLCR